MTLGHRWKRSRRESTIAVCVWLALCLSQPAEAQGANHDGGHEEDSIRCASGRPEAAIVGCTNIILDKRESEGNRAIALRNRAFQYQQLGDFEKAIADYTTALNRPEQRPVHAKTRVN